MKLTLLFSSVIVAGSLLAQQQRRPATQRIAVNRMEELKYLYSNDQVSIKSPQGPLANSDDSGQKPSALSWGLLSGSMNTYGMTGPQQRPLQYNPELDALSFIHRKSATYTVSPSIPSAAESGVIVAEISSNWGNTWDSTAIWAHTSEFGRYPQGGIYNPPGNTQLSNAFAVGTGEAVDANDFSGVWYASKKLNAFNNTASAASGAQQFFSCELPNASLYPANMQRHSWTRNGFQVTNDGMIHALGLLGNDLKGLPEIRGYAVVTGTFNGGTQTIDWRMDSIVPPAVVESDGYTKALSDGQMIWNRAGTVGYVVGIGALSNATGSNRNMQPIIYKMDKTLAGTPSWTLMNGLDFNTTFSVVPEHLPAVEVTYPSTETLALPATSDFNIAVDADNKLHIGIIFMSGYSTHPDSLKYYSRFKSLIHPTESYKWQHLPGDRPYIYDFIGNGSAPWKMVVVDSVTSESPGILPTQSGYFENPWDAASGDNQKLALDARLMLGSTPDGEYIAFCWSESDTLFTTSGFKYNNLPDLKARLLKVHAADGYNVNYPAEVPLTLQDNNVRSRATLHFMSPTVSQQTVTGAAAVISTVEISLPVTITNSNPYAQASNNATWFSRNTVKFNFILPEGVSENAAQRNMIRVFPNPVSSIVTVQLEGQNEYTQLQVLNMLGQTVYSKTLNGTGGAFSETISTSQWPAGVYVVTATGESGSSVVKLIRE